ncbi:MAG: GNAT family N-acetyltransferase [Sphingomonadales bacterium]
MITVRVAVPRDVPAVDFILGESYPRLMAGAYEPSLLAEALPMMVRANLGLLASGTYYLAEADGAPAGCGGWTFEEPGTGALEPGTAHIRHFAVRPSWTGRGVGRLLYRQCERAARAAGARRFVCFSSLNGKAFYRALGFEGERVVEIAMGPAVRLPSVIMHREI